MMFTIFFFKPMNLREWKCSELFTVNVFPFVFFQIFSYKCSSAVNCCSFLTGTLVVCGTDDSSVYLMDLRNTR